MRTPPPARNTSRFKSSLRVLRAPTQPSVAIASTWARPSSGLSPNTLAKTATAVRPDEVTLGPVAKSKPADQAGAQAIRQARAPHARPMMSCSFVVCFCEEERAAHRHGT
jgi:hypothetical protein